MTRPIPASTEVVIQWFEDHVVPFLKALQAVYEVNPVAALGHCQATICTLAKKVGEVTGVAPATVLIQMAMRVAAEDGTLIVFDGDGDGGQ